MTAAAFPRGAYTPYGYLRNPGHRARSWRHTEGGNLRAMLERVGVEWVYPTQRNPTGRAGLAIEVTKDGQVHSLRSDFEGLRSTYHSCLIFGFEWSVRGANGEARFFLDGEDTLCVCIEFSAEADVRVTTLIDGVAPAHTSVVSHRDRRIDAVLARGSDAEAAARTALARIDITLANRQAQDADFYATCPMLLGGWPPGWREGVLYDFETTRMLVEPAGGVFRDIWPAWMVSWPRVVLAEGTLDMLRLAYADPDCAQRAVLSMFRDAPQPNVPCVFFDGTPNMVAADGSVCGTSPAWCLPFLNLELLYLRSLDRDWLSELYPYACVYLDWWLTHRLDADGWLVYKCTWEAGEDGNPRLDPTGSGDRDISRRMRPVELQATVAHAARVLGFFAAELHVPADVARWKRIEDEYRHRTRQMFDAQQGRYRDVVLDQPAAIEPYWGVDSTRYSALSLTPLLLGLPLNPEEVVRHMTAPWTLWPSWTYALVESATAAGMFVPIGELVADLLERVYPVTTRHDLGTPHKPMPGVAPEFWPLDWSTFGGHDAYGWGAITTNLLIRHLMGFKESRRTDACLAELIPALPKRLLADGMRLGIGPLTYRGVTFDLWYERQNDRLQATIDFQDKRRKTFDVRLGQPYELRLD